MAKEKVFLDIVQGHLSKKDGTILVFSQFKSVLERLREVLEANRIEKVALFTGSTPQGERDGTSN